MFLCKSFFFLALLFFSSFYLQSKIFLPEISTYYLRPPPEIKYFTFGYGDILASSLWIRVLQNFDYCEGGKYQESDYVPPVRGKETLQGILQRSVKPSRCHKGWVYSMLDVITEIQPHFKTAYDVGGPFLSVAVDDREGARLIFEKGIKNYPKDWQLNFAAGYHYLWEMQDAKRAGELLLTALKNGGPSYLSSLAAGLYSEAGQLEYAHTIILENLQKDLPKEVRDRLLKRLKDIEPRLRELKKSAESP